MPARHPTGPSEFMLYFAYGSNMLKERLCHPLRVPGARWVGTGYVTGRRLAFHKRSQDGSGKCDIPLSGRPADRVYGVLYEVPDKQIAPLDAAEAVGCGYRRTSIGVHAADATLLTAQTYLAEPPYIDPELAPYTWYKELVLRGMQQNGFPEAVLDALARIKALPDPQPDRPNALEAAEALRDFQQINR